MQIGTRGGARVSTIVNLDEDGTLGMGKPGLPPRTRSSGDLDISNLCVSDWWAKELELVCEVWKYQLYTFGLYALHWLWNQTSGQGQNSILLWSCPGWEASGRCGDTHKSLTKRCCTGVLPTEQKCCLYVLTSCWEEGSVPIWLLSVLMVWIVIQSTWPCSLVLLGWNDE